MGILLLIVFIDLVGFGIVIPLLPYYALKFSASPFEVTAIMASYSFAQFFASPIWGRLSDRFGRKPILLVSLVCSVGSYVWLGFASQLWMLFAARLLAGAGAGNISAAQAYITDVTDEKNRAKGMGMIGAAFGLGFTLGPAIGGLLAGSDVSTATLSRPAFAAALLSGIALVLAAIILKESLPLEHRHVATGPSRWALAQEAFGRPQLRHIIILFFLTTTAFSGMETTFTLWANSTFGWGPQPVGFLFFYIGIVLVLVQGGLIRFLSRSLGEPRMALVGSALLVLALGGLPFSTDLVRLLIDMALMATGFGIISPALTSLVSRAAGTTERGGILGVNQSGQSLARILGPLLAGAVYGAAGRDAPYYVGAAIMIVVVLMAAAVPRGEKTR